MLAGKYRPTFSIEGNEMARPKTPRDESETQQELLRATRSVIALKGVDGATARAIATEAGVNQALVFYHFGSVTKLIIESVTQMSNARFEIYSNMLNQVKNATELAPAFLEVFEQDRKTHSFGVLTQFVAGAQSNAEIAAAVKPIFDSWLELGRSTIAKLFADKPLPYGLSYDELATAAISMLLGVQFMGSIKEYEQPIAELLEKSKETLPLIAMLPMLFGNLDTK